MNELLLKLRILYRAELALLRSHLTLLARQTIFCAAGLLFMLLVVAMINVAAFLFLTDYLDRVPSALIVAAVNAVIAGVLFLKARSVRPGPEVAMAEEVRDLAMTALESDAEGLRADFEQVRADLERIRSGLGAVFGPGGAVRGLTRLGPLLDVLTGSLRRSKGK